MWRERANRALAILEGSGDDAGDRSWQIFNHILDDNNRDDYVSRDFYNVQQVAGGLPEGVSFDDFLGMVAGHIRAELEGEGFADLDDVGFRAAVLTFDETIRRHIRFLNGVVHQGAPGEAHVQLWEWILAQRGDDQSVYSCYRNYLVDG
jgi:hypothetical protein